MAGLAPSRPSSTLIALAILMAVVSACAPAPPGPVPPDPVVVVPGMGAPALLYEPLAGRLRSDGFQVWVFQSSSLGTGDIRDAAIELEALVDAIRSTTGRPTVQIVAHSAGGLVARSFIEQRSGATKVSTLVTLGTPHRGTINADIGFFFGIGPCAFVVACTQLMPSSPFLAELNAGDDTLGSIRYTAFASGLDEVVNPFEHAFLPAEDGNVVNVLVQDQCPLRIIGHILLAADGAVYSGVRHALRGEWVQMDCLAL